MKVYEDKSKKTKKEIKLCDMRPVKDAKGGYPPPCGPRRPGPQPAVPPPCWFAARRDRNLCQVSNETRAALWFDPAVRLSCVPHAKRSLSYLL